MTESERCLAAIFAASTKEDSVDRLRTAIERAVDTFKDDTLRIKTASARRGAVADLVGLIDRCRRAKKTCSDKRKSIQLRALDLADPLIKELGRCLDGNDHLLAAGRRHEPWLRSDPTIR